MSEVMIGLFSSALAAVITNPVEILRTKMVITEEEAKYTYTNSNRKNLREILKNLIAGGGLKNLQAGLMPALSYYTVTNGVRLGFYSSMEARGFLTQNENDHLSLAKSVAVATGGGIIGGFAANPLFVLKTHSQILAGEEPGEKHPVLKSIKSIYKHKGILGFYHGYWQAIPIIVSGSVSQLVSFSYVKDWLIRGGYSKPDSFSVTTLSAIASSVVTMVVTNPVDNALIKLHHQERRGLRGYRDSFRTIFEVDGFRGFYNGGILNFLRILPHNLIILIVWDMLRTRHQEQKKSEE